MRHTRRDIQNARGVEINNCEIEHWIESKFLTQAISVRIN